MAVVAITGCTTDELVVPLSQIQLSSSVLNMKVGESLPLTVSLYPSNTTETDVTWDSVNSSVAIVDHNGLVTALKAGTAIVRVTGIPSGKKAECTVIVEPDAPSVIPVSAIVIDKGSERMVVGGTTTLKATVFPENATNKEITWSTDNASVATVNNGQVTANGKGIAVITATTVDGGKNVSCTITVEEKEVAVENIILDKEQMTINVGETTTLSATVVPSNATNKNLIWASSSPSVAMVSGNGIVTGLSKGIAVISVSTVSGDKSKFCIVTVNPSKVDVTGISISCNALNMIEGQSQMLTANVLPSDATNKQINWSSSVPAVATVLNGLVTAVAAGKTTIIAATAEGNFIATCEVTVSAAVTTIPVTGIILDSYRTEVTEGAQFKINASVTPANATIKDVNWMSSNPSVAVVSDGMVTAISAGTTTITATTVDGNKSANCVVIVKAKTVAVTDITLDKPSIQMIKGEIVLIKANVLPANATNKNVTWSSTNPSVATVANGLVTGVGEGSATIIATTEDGAKMATCLVTVKSDVIAVQGITLDKTEMTMNPGKTSPLNATVTPSNATNKNISWSSTDPGVATVSNGFVTAVAPGSTVISAITEDGKFSAFCVVEVVEKVVAVTGISINRQDISIKEGESTLLSAIITPSNATNTNVTWASANPAVAQIASNGMVTGIAAGSTIITVTSEDGGKSAFCQVTVTPKTYNVTGVSLNVSTLDIKVGGTADLVATISPANATNQNVSWSSSNPYVANVTNGTVTGIAPGTAIITVVSQEGGFTASCQVTVSENIIAVESVKLDKNELTLDEGTTATLTATINPSDATNKSLVWASSKTSIATVENGVVKALAAGQTVITVTSVDGAKSDFCIVTVEQNGGTPGEGTDVHDGDIENWKEGNQYNF